MVERLVLALTNEGDIVFDPFAGVGSALIAAVLNNRRGVGVDKEEQYVRIAEERIRSALIGTLKRRQLGTPVYVPTGREKVSRIPDEWKNESCGQILDKER